MTPDWGTRHAHLPQVRLTGKRRGGRYTAWVEDGRGSAADADGSGYVWEYGPRALWEEVESLWESYVSAGSPEAGEFGLRVTGQGQYVWLRDAASPVGGIAHG